MKKNILKRITITLLALTLVFSFTACQSPANDDSAFVGTEHSGSIILRVNPELSVNYDEHGMVTSIEGLNDDGIALLDGYTGYAGQPCKSVIRELAGKLNDAGYFVEDIDGNYRTVTMQIVPGSYVPEDDFLEIIKADIKQEIAKANPHTKFVEIDDDDYDNRYASASEPSPYITKEKAVELAYTHAGVQSSDTTLTEREYDLDDGRALYELEFFSQGHEYEYDVDARSGKILKAKCDADDDWDDQNDDDRDDRNDDDWDDQNDDDQDDDGDDDWDDQNDDDQDDRNDDDWDDQNDDDQDDDDDDWDDQNDDDQDDDDDNDDDDDDND